eukprot:877511-Amphidinium_carterae.1
MREIAVSMIRKGPTHKVAEQSRKHLFLSDGLRIPSPIVDPRFLLQVSLPAFGRRGVGTWKACWPLLSAIPCLRSHYSGVRA